MILRPVRPQSPSGPPMTNLPVGLTCQIVSSAIQPSGSALRMIGLDDLADVVARSSVSSRCWVESTICVDADRLAVVVADGDLALGVRAELAGARRRLARASASSLEDLVGVVDRRRHQFRRLAAGIAEHDALVARALVLVAGGVDALGDVGRLARAAGPRSSAVFQWKPSCS